MVITFFFFSFFFFCLKYSQQFQNIFKLISPRLSLFLRMDPISVSFSFLLTKYLQFPKPALAVKINILVRTSFSVWYCRALHTILYLYTSQVFNVNMWHSFLLINLISQYKVIFFISPQQWKHKTETSPSSFQNKVSSSQCRYLVHTSIQDSENLLLSNAGHLSWGIYVRHDSVYTWSSNNGMQTWCTPTPYCL